MSNQTQAIELVKSVEPTIATLMAEHRERRDHWHFHDFIPWEQGESFVDKPWDPSQASLSPEIRTTLVLNLLTEDNLPYYFALFGRSFDEDSPMTQWSGLWTAEEGQHAIAMRSYLLTTRNCDPAALEDERMQVVQAGWHPDFDTILDVFCYTSAQELATRISHRNAGVKSDDETAHALMSKISRDENFHYLFYRGVTTELFNQSPDLMVQALERVFSNFAMPGTMIPGFQRRALKMARLGIYNLRIHSENVIEPLIRHWKLDQLTDLSPAGEAARDTIMAMPADLIERAEIFESRQARKVARASDRKAPAAV